MAQLLPARRTTPKARRDQLLSFSSSRISSSTLKTLKTLKKTITTAFLGSGLEVVTLKTLKFELTT